MKKESNLSLSKSVIIVVLSIVVSRATGFLKEMLVPNTLGVGVIGDAYNVSIMVPEILYNLLIGGAIASALIPVLTYYLENKKEKEGWKAISSFMNAAFVVMIFLCILGMIFTEQFVRLIAVSYGNERIDQLGLTVTLTRIMFPSFIFLMLSGICNGVLNTYKRFALSTLGPAIYNVFCALSLLLLSPYGVETVAYGVLTSSFIYFVCQLVFCFKHFRLYTPIINLKNEGFNKLIKLAVPSLLTSSIIQINVVIALQFVSFFTAGSITAFRMADRMWQLPYGIVAQGIGIAILPSLAAMASKNNMIKFKDILVKALFSIIIISAPIAIVITLSGNTLLDVAFRITDKINAGDIALTAQIFSFFAIALIFQSLVTVLNRAFYAVNNTKTPLLTGFISIIFNVVLGFYLKGILGIGGIALAYSIASIINAGLLFYYLNRDIINLDLNKIVIFISKTIISSIICGITLYVINKLFVINNLSKLLKLFYLSIQMAVTITVYLMSMYFLKIDMITNPIRKYYSLIFCRKIK